jgi:transposase-like protein
MDERLQFVARRLAGEAMADLCREFGISRKTGRNSLREVSGIGTVQKVIRGTRTGTNLLVPVTTARRSQGQPNSRISRFEHRLEVRNDLTGAVLVHLLEHGL